MKKVATGLVCMFLCLAVFTVVSHAAEKVVKLELSTFTPTHDKLTWMLEDWCKDVAKRTNGRVTVTLHPGSTLTPAPQTYDSVVREIIDVGFAGMGMTPGRFPLTEIMDLPFGLKSGYLATKMSNDFVKKFKPKELDDTKLFLLLTHGPGILHSRKPVRKLEDLQGLKLRCAGGAVVGMVKALGAVPVVIPTGDTYDALRKGIADGVLGLWDAMETFKWKEVLDHSTLNYRTAYESTGFLAMNKSKWNSLPPDVQKIMDQLADEYAEKLSKLWDQKEQDAIKVIQGSKKHTTIPLSPEEEGRWYQKIVPLYDAYVKDKSAKGLPAADALKFCQEWVKANQK